MVAALLVQPWWAGWELKPIHQCTQEEVALILQESLAFWLLVIRRDLVCRLQKPWPADAPCWATPIGWSRIDDSGADHGVALEVSYGDWQGFVDGLRA